MNSPRLPLLAQSEHHDPLNQCPLLGAEQAAHQGQGAPDCGEYCEAAGANSTNARSVIPPLNPGRRMRSRRRLVLRIQLTIAAEPARGGHALFKACETAICPAAIRPAVVQRTPWIVLGFGACSNAKNSDANSQHE